MKLQNIIPCLSLLLSVGNLFGQPNQAGKLFIPFLDKESQSNIIVTVSELGRHGQPCPLEYTNALSNTNLFTLEEQKTIKEVFVKYKNVTTNSGPPGTVLANLYRTNFVIKTMDRTVEVEDWIANFQYTNFEAHEEIKFGAGMLAEFRNNSNDGYSLSFADVGGGTLLNFGEIKHGLPNGLFVRVADAHDQGLTWDYKSADFSNSHIVEYEQFTNGLVLGKYFTWNSRNGNLTIEAEFREPYDLEKHRIDLKMLQNH